MTREKAIIRLRRISNSLSKYCDVNDCICGNCAKCYEALDMAEKALEQKLSCRNPRQVDRISRQDAVNEIHKYFVEEIGKTPTEIDKDGYESYADMPTVNSLLACNKELSKRIKSLPSAEPKRGKWIIDDKEAGRIWHCHCSNCGKDPQDHIGGTENCWLVRLPKYCPNCGERMESDEE